MPNRWQNIFDQQVKNDLITYDNIHKIATGQGVDYTAVCLFDYNRWSKIQQINFTGNLVREGNAKKIMFFITEEAKFRF